MITQFMPLKLLRILFISVVLFLLLESIGMPAVKPAEIVSVRAGAYLTVQKARQAALSLRMASFAGSLMRSMMMSRAYQAWASNMLKV